MKLENISRKHENYVNNYGLPLVYFWIIGLPLKNYFGLRKEKGMDYWIPMPKK